MTQKNGGPVSTADLMEVASENIHRLREGETTPAVANSIVGNIAVMLRIAKMQMEYAKMTGKTPNIPFLSDGVS